MKAEVCRVNAEISQINIRTKLEHDSISGRFHEVIIIEFTFIDFSGEAHHFNFGQTDLPLVKAARYVKGDRGVLVYKRRRSWFGREKKEFVDFYKDLTIEKLKKVSRL